MNDEAEEVIDYYQITIYLLLCLPHQLETLKIINKYHFINKKKFNIEYIYI